MQYVGSYNNFVKNCTELILDHKFLVIYSDINLIDR